MLRTSLTERNQWDHHSSSIWLSGSCIGRLMSHILCYLPVAVLVVVLCFCSSINQSFCILGIFLYFLPPSLYFCLVYINLDLKSVYFFNLDSHYVCFNIRIHWILMIRFKFFLLFKLKNIKIIGSLFIKERLLIIYI